MVCIKPGPDKFPTCLLQLERIANTEPVGINVPAVSDISKASAKGARQLTVRHTCLHVSTVQCCFHHKFQGNCREGCCE